MVPRLLLDTHVLVRWLTDDRRLSKEQFNAIKRATERGEPVALSAITLLEFVLLSASSRLSLKGGVHSYLDDLRTNPAFHLVPLSYEVASEVAYLANLKDPSDCVIVATARVHGLTLITSDQRIIESKLVPVIE